MQVEWLTAAVDDLREIARCVALNFGYVTAERTVACVIEETWRLADFPEIGRLCDEYDGSRRIYRALNTRHDRIVYTVTAERVLIVAVFDSRRDPDSLTALLKERDSLNQ
jgi:plasmid stabilization system protein ParE